MADRMGDLAALDDYAPDAILPPPYRAPGQDSTAAKIGAAILTGPLRAAMYPGKVWSGEANPYEGDEATDWATGTALGMIGRGASGVPQGAVGVGGGRIVQPAKMSDLADMQGIRAYHGSPHDFDRFDISKIGTGEGAQVYGHGLYFAENPAVAESYKPRFIDNGLHPLNPANFWTPARVPDPKSPGRMYEVNIAAKPEQFLDWDKPLAKMSPEVRQQLNDAWIAHPESHADQTGRQIYAAHDWDADAHNVLRDAGIPGIKYLDQGSRKPGFSSLTPAQLDARIASIRSDIASGGGNQQLMRDQLARMEFERANYKPQTSNYVVFDDKLINILRKYGMAGMAPAGVLGSLADQRNYQPDYQ